MSREEESRHRLGRCLVPRRQIQDASARVAKEGLEAVEHAAGLALTTGAFEPNAALAGHRDHVASARTAWVGSLGALDQVDSVCVLKVAQSSAIRCRHRFVRCARLVHLFMLLAIEVVDACYRTRSKT